MYLVVKCSVDLYSERSELVFTPSYNLNSLVTIFAVHNYSYVCNEWLSLLLLLLLSSNLVCFCSYKQCIIMYLGHAVA
jgi:hypothetical protein